MCSLHVSELSCSTLVKPVENQWRLFKTDNGEMDVREKDLRPCQAIIYAPGNWCLKPGNLPQNTPVALVWTSGKTTS